MPEDRQCSIDGCANTGKITRGWCAMHYRRWQKHGEPGPAERLTFRTPEESFAARTRQDGDCIVWNSSTTSEGYGELWVVDRMVKAHRYAWERANGPVPAGAEVDHRCWNRACVRLEHLRLSTKAENMRNLPGPKKNSSTGVRNVYAHRGKFQVKLGLNREQISFGFFDTLEEAEAVARKARHDLYGEYAGRP